MTFLGPDSTSLLFKLSLQRTSVWTCKHLGRIISNYDVFPPLFHFAFVTLVSFVLLLGDIAAGRVFLLFFLSRPIYVAVTLLRCFRHKFCKYLNFLLLRQLIYSFQQISKRVCLFDLRKGSPTLFYISRLWLLRWTKGRCSLYCYVFFSFVSNVLKLLTCENCTAVGWGDNTQMKELVL